MTDRSSGVHRSTSAPSRPRPLAESDGDLIQKPPTRALVIHPHFRDDRDRAGDIALRPAEIRLPQSRLEEAVALAGAINLDVVDALLIPIKDMRPATYIGRGKVDEIAERVKTDRIELVVADCELSPGQQRNLERAWNTKVIDRTGLILEIFGERAQTREGRLQVELAHLSYQRSRLVRSWTHLERQRGGFGFLGGPGETQIELDRRMLEERIGRIKKALDSVVRMRQLHRRARKRVPYPVVALVGYTNAGKSTLFNRLTQAEVLAEDMLFATLDPTMRKIKLPSGRIVILSDTVGFVSNLPTHLVAAFRATLEEVTEADVVIHVRDVAHPESAAQKADVEAILKDLGVGEGATPRVIEALNKADLLTPAEIYELTGRTVKKTEQVLISALKGSGIGDLLEAVDESLSARGQLHELVLAPAQGAALAWLYAHGQVVTRSDEADGVHLQVKLDDAAWGRFAKSYLEHNP